jgi:H/ACA ribonucleoprotein complex subunit 4
VQKYGRPNEATPAKWNSEYKDYDAPADGTTPQPVTAKTAKEDTSSAPSVAPNGTSEAMEVDEPKANGEKEKEKKRKRHEGETPEEKAERKRRKKEKKEKKEKKAAKKASKGAEASETEDSD